MDVSKDHAVITFMGTFDKWHGAEELARAIRGIVVEDAGWLTRLWVRFLLRGDGLQMPRMREILGTPMVRKHVRFSDLTHKRRHHSTLLHPDILVPAHVPNEVGS